ncbi:MAG: VWA domain-containing protein [Candidatus Sulfopaludibacter sp.]|nr:VWA domain-containing protein [Candidatus Sulfopaludibacter sp.]
MSRFAVFLLLAACLAAQPRGARRPMPAAPTVPKALQVDAVVTDVDGHPAPGLTAADFDLSVDGKSMPITSFRFVSRPPRRIIVLVDDTGLSPGGLERVRAALTGFVDGQMQAGDEAAVLRTRSGSGVLGSLTSDKKILGEAIGQVEGTPEPASDEFVLAGIVTTLRAAFSGLTAVPGRKAVVLISENLELARRHPERFERMAALTATASAVFYSVDLQHASTGIELDNLMLAGDTGGLNLGPDPAVALARILRDQEGYYQLGCESEEAGQSQIKVGTRDTRFYTRYRGIPLGKAAQESDLRYRTSPQVLATAIYSPFAGDAIRALVYPDFAYSFAPGLDLIIQVWVDVSGLTFTHQLSGIHSASAQVAISVLGNTGTAVVDTTHDVSLQLTGEDYPKLLQQGWVGQAELRVPAPGVYLVRAAVLDGTSSRMGSAGQLVEVPDVASGQLILSGIAIHGKNPAAHRVFAPGAVLDFEYQILNPVNAQGQPADLESVVHLFRGTEAVFAGNAQPLPAKSPDETKIRLIAGELTLGRKLPAGHYWLQVTVSGKQSQEPRRAQQWVDFEVRP